MPPRQLACPTTLPSVLTIEERREVIELFFLAHPGPGRRGLGLGRAIADFVEWEASSGRLDDHGGSSWWRAVNESFVLDLRAMLPPARPPARLLPTGCPSGGAPVLGMAQAAWATYMTATDDAQRALWSAHQVSLLGAVEAAFPLLACEPAEEQTFVGIVLGVVARTAAECSPTYTTDLARSTRRLYPSGYPISEVELERLASRLSRKGSGATGHSGTR
ncbi:MAG: hypothetical protein ACYDGN_09610 [Acidimicrobiales bacterium]